jgi:ferric-dicitrate binding protein FerR (iron transport regulator)
MAGGDTADSIDQAAMGWVMALHDAPDDAQVRESLAVWLAADPAHRPAYALARRVWLLTGLLPPTTTDEATSEKSAAPCTPRSE